MSQLAERRYSYAEYLEQERASEIKHEYLDGVILAMAGGSLRHSRLKTELAAEFTLALRGKPCDSYDADARVRTLATGLATYPDLSVVCGDLERHPEDVEALTNPVLLAEVLSPSTEAYDRGEKFHHYRTFASLRHYLLVSTETTRIEWFSRDGGGRWVLEVFGPGDSLTLDDLGVTLSIDALYASLPPVEAPTT